MFAGHNAWKFKQDPFYSNGFIPSVKELVNRIVTGINTALVNYKCCTNVI